MGLLDRFRQTPAANISETRVEESQSAFGQITRHGFETDIPYGGTETAERAKTYASQRRMEMNELHQAYLACPWVSTCADTVARMVTAGGLQIVPDDGDNDQDRPPLIQQLDQLLKIANDREDGIQLLRSTVTDLMVFGDGFLEVGWISTFVAALWSLDATTMAVAADMHGEVSGYVQDVDSGREARFNPDEVIHVSLDSPRGGIYGVSPTQKLMVTITTWLFAAACLKEYYRRGMPADIAIDLGKSTTDTQLERFRTQYQRKRLGPRNIGQPIITRTGVTGQPTTPPVKELSQQKIKELHETLNRCRDEIISGFGLSPASVGVIESGNLGSGSGDTQAKQTHYGTTLPIQNILLEKLNFALVTMRGITGWHIEFGEVDYRDSKVIEEIRDTRVRNGSWTLNRYRAEIGEDSVDGGDDAVMVDRQNLVLWADMAAMSKALIAGKSAGLIPQQQLDDDEDDPADAEPSDPGRALARKDTEEAAGAYREARLSESWAQTWERMRSA